MSFDVGDIGCWLWVDMAPTLCHAVGPLGMCFEVDQECRIIDSLTRDIRVEKSWLLTLH